MNSLTEKPSVIRTRIAPTPSGFLHTGNAFNFLLAVYLARQQDGTVRLRIDDLDAPRVRREYLDDIFESLAWLGIQPDEGPHDTGEQSEIFSQSLRTEQYDLVLERLAAAGYLFACICSRKDLLQHNDHGQYTGTCIHKNIPLHAPGVSWRILTPRNASAVTFEDKLAGRQETALWDTQRHFVVRRRDGLPAYHIASLWDDVDYRINTIIRGQDLLSSTAAQLYLARILGYDSFNNVHFYHHPLIEDEAGCKLSKSAGSQSLKALRGVGIAVADVHAAFTVWRRELGLLTR